MIEIYMQIIGKSNRIMNLKQHMSLHGLRYWCFDLFTSSNIFPLFIPYHLNKILKNTYNHFYSYKE